jgi:hypothetical protein
MFNKCLKLLSKVLLKVLSSTNGKYGSDSTVIFGCLNHSQSFFHGWTILEIEGVSHCWTGDTK